MDFPFQFPSECYVPTRQNIVTESVGRTHLSFPALHAALTQFTQTFPLALPFKHYTIPVAYQSGQHLKATSLKNLHDEPGTLPYLSAQNHRLLERDPERGTIIHALRCEEVLHTIISSYHLDVNYHYHQGKHGWSHGATMPRRKTSDTPLPVSVYNPQALTALADLMTQLQPGKPKRTPHIQRPASLPSTTVLQDALLRGASLHAPRAIRVHLTENQLHLNYITGCSVNAVALWVRQEQGWNLSKLNPTAASVMLRDLLTRHKCSIDQYRSFWTFKRRGEERLHLQAVTPLDAFAQLIVRPGVLPDALDAFTLPPVNTSRPLEAGQ